VILCSFLLTYVPQDSTAADLLLCRNFVKSVTIYLRNESCEFADLDLYFALMFYVCDVLDRRFRGMARRIFDCSTTKF